MLAGPLFCDRATARFADSPASSCGAIEEVKGAARAEEEEEEETEGDDDDDDDDEISRGTSEGATVRRMFQECGRGSGSPELGVESLAKELILLPLLAEQGVFCLDSVEGALELVDVRLLALSRVLRRRRLRA